jgi:hypothetical protein
MERLPFLVCLRSFDFLTKQKQNRRMQTLLHRTIRTIIHPLIEERDKWNQVNSRLTNEMHEHKIDMETLGLAHALDIIEHSEKLEHWIPVVQKFPELKRYADLMQQYEQAGEEFKKLRPPSGWNTVIEEFWDTVARVFDDGVAALELEVEFEIGGSYDNDDDIDEAETYIRSLGYFKTSISTNTRFNGKKRKTFQILTCKFIG